MNKEPKYLSDTSILNNNPFFGAVVDHLKEDNMIDLLEFVSPLRTLYISYIMNNTTGKP